MKIKLLMVEDEQGIRDMIRFSLAEDEFDIVDAENSAQAMQYLADLVPDLILVDWMLPGKTGVEFIQWVKQQETLCP
jgi:two-component system phosphate regulon response regulator PhoB